MQKKKDAKYEVIDLDRERRIRDKVEKIKAVYNNDPDGLERLVDKLNNAETNPPEA